MFEPVTFAIIGFVIVVLLASLRILREYERAVVFTLGKYSYTWGPGLIIVIPIIQEMVRVDTRVIAEDVPSQDVISKDNVTVRVSAVIYYRVSVPDRAVNEVMNFHRATSELAQTTLRSVLGKHDLDEMLSDRAKLNSDIQKILAEHTEQWGISVSNVEIKHIDLDESMIRAIAKQAEAERVRRAKIINAEGEQQAAKKLVEAGKALDDAPSAMILRYLSTIQESAAMDSNTVLFPLPSSLLDLLTNKKS